MAIKGSAAAGDCHGETGECRCPMSHDLHPFMEAVPSISDGFRLEPDDSMALPKRARHRMRDTATANLAGSLANCTHT